MTHPTQACSLQLAKKLSWGSRTPLTYRASLQMFRGVFMDLSKKHFDFEPRFKQRHPQRRCQQRKRDLAAEERPENKSK